MRTERESGKLCFAASGWARDERTGRLDGFLGEEEQGLQTGEGVPKKQLFLTFL